MLLLNEAVPPRTNLLPIETLSGSLELPFIVGLSHLVGNAISLAIDERFPSNCGHKVKRRRGAPLCQGECLLSNCKNLLVHVKCLTKISTLTVNYSCNFIVD